MNGFHDAANSIATVVSTGVLKPQQAVLFAAFFNVLALGVFQLMSPRPSAKGIVEAGVVDQYVVFGALVGAIAWNLITWWYGIRQAPRTPDRRNRRRRDRESGPGSLLISGIGKTVLFLFVSPLLGFLLGSLLVVLVANAFGARRRYASTTSSAACSWCRRGSTASAMAATMHRRRSGSSGCCSSPPVMSPPVPSSRRGG
jgi:PiT family inorganic phosphate transporter